MNVLKLTGCFLVMVILLAACSKQEMDVYAENADHEVTFNTKKALIQNSPVINAMTGEEVGYAQLVRNKSGVSMEFTSTDLDPGYAYTIWWVIWNNPEFCAGPGCAESDFAEADDIEVEVLYAAGNVVGGSGKGTFAGSLKVGDAKGSINEEIFYLPTYGGLKNTQKAEIHLVLRSHGPKVPGLVNAQINTHQGGCEVNFPPFTAIPDKVGECGDYEFAMFFPN